MKGLALAEKFKVNSTSPRPILAKILAKKNFLHTQAHAKNIKMKAKKYRNQKKIMKKAKRLF